MGMHPTRDTLAFKYLNRAGGRVMPDVRFLPNYVGGIDDKNNSTAAKLPYGIFKRRAPAVPYGTDWVRHLTPSEC